MKFKTKIIILVLVMLFLLYFGVQVIQQNQHMKALEKERLEYEQEIEALNLKIIDLKDKIDNKNSDEYIEKMAREKLKMVKPDEIIYIIKEE